MSPLSTLTNLTSLNLYGNEIFNVSPLVTLTNLTSLNISGNPLYCFAQAANIAAIEANGTDVTSDCP